MTIVTPALARRQLTSLLDCIEHGEEVIIERNGVRFRMTLEASRNAQPKPVPASPLVVDDPELLSGSWTWQTGEDGELSFQPRRIEAATSRRQVVGHSLDAFIGTWSREEEQELLEAVEVFEQVDETFWA